MSVAVYANGMSIACKVADGKTIAAFPDVCLSPPAPPIPPIPYPNTAAASDTTDGSKTVQIGGEEVMLKNKSTFKTSTGNEAATKSFGMGVVTHQITGEASFVAWSMDVKFEDENIPRHMDLMGHNEACDPMNTPPWQYLDKPDVPPSDHPCKRDIEKAQSGCRDSPPTSVNGKVQRVCSEDGECERSLRCILIPKGRDKQKCCDTANTGDHIIEDHWVRPGHVAMPDFEHIESLYYGAPTMCVDGSRFTGSHGLATAARADHENAILGKTFSYQVAKEWALESHNLTYPNAGCTQGCLESQLDAFYGKDGNKQCQASQHKQALTDEQKKLNLKNAAARKLKTAGGL